MLGKAAFTYKMRDRTVTVKGLSERTVEADTAIWPISFRVTGNDLGELYSSIQDHNKTIILFLSQLGFLREEITISSPAITDRQAENLSSQNSQFRYSAQSTITVFSTNTGRVLAAIEKIGQLVSEGIVISGSTYSSQIKYLYTGLNEIKPEMIEEATRNGRQAAEKFARDSMSTLGKIKTAHQGQFSIQDRDANTRHIKKIRVVSTIQYYLTD